ncbi:argininosuccinate lyase [Peribacillus cavernae]|nr:hypothetical protein [Peribacillus cavernae]MDQ0221385.1 argininosuccinate lyase [Peribacillus cavernae]
MILLGAHYLLETSKAIVANTGRWIQDFLQQVRREFGSFLVADPYVQVSSIMPQKRNGFITTEDITEVSTISLLSRDSIF